MQYVDVINKWASPTVLARALNVEVETVRKWRQRDNIPSRYWINLTMLAQLEGYKSITLTSLAIIEAKNRGVKKSVIKNIKKMGLKGV